MEFDSRDLVKGANGTVTLKSSKDDEHVELKPRGHQCMSRSDRKIIILFIGYSDAVLCQLLQMYTNQYPLPNKIERRARFFSQNHTNPFNLHERAFVPGPGLFHMSTSQYDSKRDMDTSTNYIESQVTAAHYINGSLEDNWITVEGMKNLSKTWI